MLIPTDLESIFCSLATVSAKFFDNLRQCFTTRHINLSNNYFSLSVCLDGHELINGTCVPCAPDFYQPFHNTGTCMECTIPYSGNNYTDPRCIIYCSCSGQKILS